MTLHLALPLVALLLNVALIAIALAGGGRRPVDRIFAVFVSSMVLWNGGVFWLRTARTADEAAFARSSSTWAHRAPAVYLHFLRVPRHDGPRLVVAARDTRWPRRSPCQPERDGGDARGLWTYWGWVPVPDAAAPFLIFFNGLIYGLWRLVRAKAGSSYHRLSVS
jgi:hypothetical protein